jgi:hypothetical protein
MFENDLSKSIQDDGTTLRGPSNRRFYHEHLDILTWPANVMGSSIPVVVSYHSAFLRSCLNFVSRVVEFLHSRWLDTSLSNGRVCRWLRLWTRAMQYSIGCPESLTRLTIDGNPRWNRSFVMLGSFPENWKPPPAGWPFQLAFGQSFSRLISWLLQGNEIGSGNKLLDIVRVTCCPPTTGGLIAQWYRWCCCTGTRTLNFRVASRV